MCSWFILKGRCLWSCCHQPLKFWSPPTPITQWSVTLVCLYTYCTCLCLQMCSSTSLSGIFSSPQECLGWSEVKWHFPQEPPVDGVLVDNRGSRSILQLFNITWRNSGRYTCEEASSDQSRNVDVFIPGQGNHLPMCVPPVVCVLPAFLVMFLVYLFPPQVPMNGLSQWIWVW